MMWYERGYISEADFYGDIMRMRREEARVTTKQVSDATGIRIDYIYQYEVATKMPELVSYVAIENYLRTIVRGRMIKDGYLPEKSHYTSYDLAPITIEDFYKSSLRYKRMEAELTLREAANFSGIDFRQISRYENGDDIPTITSYCKLENLYRMEALRVKRSKHL